MSELRVAVGGCPFAIGPAETLTLEQRRALGRLGSEDGGGRPFRVRVVDDVLRVEDAPPDGEPAAIRVDGDRVHLVHQRFRAEIDPFGYEGVVSRGDAAGTFALESTIRTALSCRLPLEGGLLLHSAGIVFEGKAYLFYGVSGAGKSTLASFMTSVLSDELIVTSDGFARATGFWGTLDAADAPAGAYPLAAVVELARGEGVALRALSPREAYRALLLAAVVPPHPRLWTAALKAVGELARHLAFRLAWTPSPANAKRLLDLLPR